VGVGLCNSRDDDDALFLQETDAASPPLEAPGPRNKTSVRSSM